jgi:hypothetical protein
MQAKKQPDLCSAAVGSSDGSTDPRQARASWIIVCPGAGLVGDLGRLSTSEARTWRAEQRPAEPLTFPEVPSAPPRCTCRYTARYSDGGHPAPGTLITGSMSARERHLGRHPYPSIDARNSSSLMGGADSKPSAPNARSSCDPLMPAEARRWHFIDSQCASLGRAMIHAG